MIDGLTKRQQSFLWHLFKENYWGLNSDYWWTTSICWEQYNRPYTGQLVDYQLVYLEDCLDGTVRVKLTDRGVLIARLIGEP